MVVALWYVVLLNSYTTDVPEPWTIQHTWYLFENTGHLPKHVNKVYFTSCVTIFSPNHETEKLPIFLLLKLIRFNFSILSIPWIVFYCRYNMSRFVFLLYDLLVSSLVTCFHNYLFVHLFYVNISTYMTKTFHYFTYLSESIFLLLQLLVLHF